jgi:hypothetical protein
LNRHPCWSQKFCIAKQGKRLLCATVASGTKGDGFLGNAKREMEMGLTSSDIAALVFKPLINRNIGPVSLDGRMVTVLMALDGQKTLSQVAQATNIDMGELRQIMERLLKMQMATVVNRAVKVKAADGEFIEFLISRMSVAIGPLGELVVKEELEEMGFNKENFPAARSAELINNLSREIQREDKRMEFKQAMLKKIKEKGY